MTAFPTETFKNEWIPASKNVPFSKQKVMVVLHGLGDSLDAFKSLKQDLRLPNFNYLLLNAPKKYQKGFTWGPLAPKRKGSLGAVRKKLFKLVDELKEAGFKSKDIFFLGHSQGCLVACDLAMEHPDAFGGVIGVSGYVWFFKGWKNRVQAMGAQRTPWLITHGSRDRIIRPQEIREDVSALVSGRVPVLYREFSKGHDFDYLKEVPFIRTWIRHPRRIALRRKFSELA